MSCGGRESGDQSYPGRGGWSGDAGDDDDDGNDQIMIMMMQVRASNMVRAGESLMKLVSDLKIYLILNDFPNVNEAISSNSNMFKEMQVCWTVVRDSD